MLGGTMDYGERIEREHGRRRQRPVISDKVRRFVSFIPVYPEEIEKAALRHKAGVSEGEFSALIEATSTGYLLCEDGGRVCLLRRGVSYVD